MIVAVLRSHTPPPPRTSHTYSAYLLEPIVSLDRNSSSRETRITGISLCEPLPLEGRVVRLNQSASLDPAGKICALCDVISDGAGCYVLNLPIIPPSPNPPIGVCIRPHISVEANFCFSGAGWGRQVKKPIVVCTHCTLPNSTYMYPELQQRACIPNSFSVGKIPNPPKLQSSRQADTWRLR